MVRIERVTRTLYQFDELSDEAKERARDWYRGCGDCGHGWDDALESDYVLRGNASLRRFVKREFMV